MRILVTDGDNRAALAITRSLGQRGHWIAVGERDIPALAQTSRYCAHRLKYPDPFSRDASFVDELAKSVEQLRIDVLMPVSDVSNLLISGNRERFEPRCRIPIAPHAVLRRAADKIDVLKMAIRLGVPVPRTVVLEKRDSTADVDLPFPVVIKAHSSRIRVGSSWISSTVSYASQPRDLAAQLAARHDAEFPIALQERVNGPGLGVFLCYNRGAVVGVFAHRRIREKPPSGGVSVLSESVSLSQQAKRYAELLLTDIGWHGVAMVEFKHDERDGVPKLMEINGRFWGSLQLAIDAGVDFPHLLLNTLSDMPPQLPKPYKTGVRSRWFWGDVDALLIQLLGRGTGRGRSVDYGRLRALRDFLHLWGPNLCYENPRRSDIRPFMHETRTWLKGRA